MICFRLAKKAKALDEWHWSASFAIIVEEHRQLQWFPFKKLTTALSLPPQSHTVRIKIDRLQRNIMLLSNWFSVSNAPYDENYCCWTGGVTYLRVCVCTNVEKSIIKEAEVERKHTGELGPPPYVQHKLAVASLLRVGRTFFLRYRQTYCIDHTRSKHNGFKFVSRSEVKFDGIKLASAPNICTLGRSHSRKKKNSLAYWFVVVQYLCLREKNSAKYRYVRTWRVGEKNTEVWKNGLTRNEWAAVMKTKHSRRKIKTVLDEETLQQDENEYCWLLNMLKHVVDVKKKTEKKKKKKKGVHWKLDLKRKMYKFRV